MWPKTITMYETSDGDLHRSVEQATFSQGRIEATRKAMAQFEAGASLRAALLSNNLIRPDSYPELEDLVAKSELVIEHWQCRTQPGYRVVKLLKDGDVYVFGDAGSWSGPYGNQCTLRDVVRYWLDTKRRADEHRKSA